MSSGKNPALFTRRSKARLQIATLWSISVAWPVSSKAITTTPAPYR
jgi:hypothetical protein